MHYGISIKGNIDMEYCTKKDLAEVKEELKSDIASVKAELKSDIAGLKGDISELKQMMLTLTKQTEQNSTMLLVIARAVGMPRLEAVKAPE